MFMSLIDLEKRKLNEWAKKKKDAESFFFCDSADSYYSVSDDKEVIYEFHYETIPNLKKLMEEKKKVVHDAQIDLVCSVAAFKYRNSIVKPEAKKKELVDEKNMIPDFIYNF